MSKCMNCGAELQPGARFCKICGKSVPAAPAPQKPAASQPVPGAGAQAPIQGGKQCPACGNPLKPGAKFCTKCGANVDEMTVRITPVARSNDTPAAGGPVVPGGRGFNELGGETGGRRGPGVQTGPGAQTGTGTQGGPGVQPGGGVQRGSGGQGGPHVGPQRSVNCPKCGLIVPPGRNVCPRCNTPVGGSARTPFGEQDAPIRETRSRTGMWVAIASVAVLLLGAAAALLIFWDDLFGRKEEPRPSPTNPVILEHTQESPTAPSTEPDRTDATEYNTEKPETEVHTEPAPSLPTETRQPEPTEPAPTVPPTTAPVPTPAPTVPIYSWEEVRTLVAVRYAGEIRMSSEDPNNYYVEVRYPDGNLHYVLRVDKQTAAIAVVSEYAQPSTTPTPTAPPATTPTPIYSEHPGQDPYVPDVPAEEQVSIGAVRTATVDDYMDSHVSSTEYSYTFIDLKTGLYNGSENQDEPMSSSVMIGIPVMYAVNRLAESGELSLSDTMTVQNLGGGGRGVLTSGRMTVGELLEKMLRESSGAAINNLAWYIGMDRINQICWDAGYDSVSYANYIASPSIVDYTASDNYVSTRDICGMLYELYNGDGPVDRDFLEDNFGITVGADPNSGLGRRVSGAIGSFNGLKETKYNDLIIVQRNNRAYAVVMMAHGNKYKDIMNAMDGVGNYIDGKLMGE